MTYNTKNRKRECELYANSNRMKLLERNYVN